MIGGAQEVMALHDVAVALGAWQCNPTPATAARLERCREKQRALWRAARLARCEADLEALADEAPDLVRKHADAWVIVRKKRRRSTPKKSTHPAPRQKGTSAPAAPYLRLAWSRPELVTLDAGAVATAVD